MTFESLGTLSTQQIISCRWVITIKIQIYGFSVDILKSSVRTQHWWSYIHPAYWGVEQIVEMIETHGESFDRGISPLGLPLLHPARIIPKGLAISSQRKKNWFISYRDIGQRSWGGSFFVNSLYRNVNQKRNFTTYRNRINFWADIQNIFATVRHRRRRFDSDRCSIIEIRNTRTSSHATMAAVVNISACFTRLYTQ